MSNTGVTNISLINGYYIVSKTINGQHRHYGCFKTLQEAINHKNYCEKHNWNKECIPLKRPFKKHSTLKNIQEIKGKGWQVHKTIDRVKRQYGWFNSLVDAKEHRDYCEKHNWGEECILRKYNPHKLPRYISVNVGKYVLQKHRNDGTMINIRFNRLEDAVHERDLLMSVDWDEDKLIELDEAEGTL